MINVHCDEARLAFACEFLKCFVDYRKQPIFFIADKVLLPHGLEVEEIRGPQEIKFCLVPQHTSTVVPQHTSIVVPYYTSTVVPQYTSTVVPQYTSTEVPQYTSTVVPQYTSTTLPQYVSTAVPRYNSTAVPQYTSTVVLVPELNYNTILAKYQQRLNNHSSSEHAKNPRGLAPPEPQIKVGDLVYLVSDRNKLHARNRYLVTEINDPWCFVKKFSGCQLRASSYKVKLSECYVVPTQVNSPSSCVNQADDEVHDEQASVPDPPQPPLDITHPFDANPESLDTSIPLPQGDGGETLSDPKEPEVPRAPVEPDVSYSNPDESRAQPAPPRPQRSQWDSRHKTTLGEWKDQPKNGLDFWNGESPKRRSRNARLLSTMKNGDRAEWDCTMLFYAIRFSDCIHGLNSVVRSNIDDLRNIRNEIAHDEAGQLSDGNFNIVMSRVKTAFVALGLPTLKISEVQNQTTFPTEELSEILGEVNDLRQKLQEKEKELQEKGKVLQVKEEQRLALQEQLHADVSPFCILPAKPTHDIAARESEVDEIMRNLQTLKRTDDGMSILYLSGNPGSGKSQLARLAAKRFYDEVKETPSAASFVMTLNAESPETILNSLHSDLGETDQAKDYYKRALEIRLKKVGPDHVDVAATYNNLGSLHSDLGETDQAKDYYKRALEIRLKKLGPDHVDVAASYNNLGSLHSDLGETDQAKDYYKRALEIRLKKLGPDHVDVAASYNNLGTLHSDLGEIDQAKDYHKRALEIHLKKLGPDHVKVAASYNNLGSLHNELVETDQAKDYHKRALEIHLKKLGPDHVKVAGSYNNLGNLHKALDETDQAKDYHKRALEIRLKKLGPDHVDVAASYKNLGNLHSDLDELQEAKHCLDRALVILISKYGQDHVGVQEVRRNLSRLQQKRRCVVD
ncbi:Nephrocystin-3 [Stylophora pistillata]|uniref:Nephrocystin-3 n=1 Tax=Stylophora pistillata TaxID=50429 RepID=A0A2B4R887_STYPI|nr:Nephrocystin-3 [Stylophora pistillata]